MEAADTLLDSSGFSETVSGDTDMRISVTIFVILISACIVNASVLDPVIENIVHKKATAPPGEVGGIWKKKTVWKPRWVKEWKSAKVTKPVWRKVWSPIQIREWLPIPKPPPGWDAASPPIVPAPAHPKPPKTPPKDSQGHDSFPVHSTSTLPLWDPVPYPESQQPPPPPPFPQPLQGAGGSSCGKGGCDNAPSHSFNHEQILEILGPRYQQPGEYFQNPEYSETVNHLTRLPPEGNNWRAPQPFPDSQFDNRFVGFPGLPEFLIPPKTQLQNDFRLQLPNNQPIINNPPNNQPIVNNHPHNQPIINNHPNNQPIINNHPNNQPIINNHPHNQPIINNPPIPPPNPQNIPRWNPIPPENKLKGHFITKAPDQPYKFEVPELRNNQNQTTSHAHQNQDRPSLQGNNVSNALRPHVDGDFIQEAQLVGEYHYSEFDLPAVKLEPNQPSVQQEQVKPQPPEKVKPTEPPQKPTANQQPVAESKPKPAQKEVKQPPVQSGSHIHKKHIATPPSKSNIHFQQQEALIKEIFPIFKPLPPVNRTSNHRFEPPAGNKNQEKQPNHSSTKLVPIVPHNQSNSQQQKQVYPVFRPQGASPNHSPPNHRAPPNSGNKQQQEKPPPNTTKPVLPPKLQSNSTNVQQQKQIYPVFEVPSNHRFSANSEPRQQQKPFPSQNSTKLLPVPPTQPPVKPPMQPPVKPPTQPPVKPPTPPDNPIFNKASTVQLVFATAPDDQAQLESDRRKTTTTEPYEIVFSSSLLSTTEAVTKSPVIIVTPINTKS